MSTEITSAVTTIPGSSRRNDFFGCAGRRADGRVGRGGAGLDGGGLDGEEAGSGDAETAG
jgi:hypothetical protein